MGRLAPVGGVSDAYRMQWRWVIRPHRDQYSTTEMGDATFLIQDRIYERIDLQLVNGRGQKLECSHFVPCFRPPEPLPCVVYLHGSSSSRLEAWTLRRFLLPRDITIFCFDFAGSGRSEGEFVSLGYFEQQDIGVVIEHLRSTGCVSSIGLWGRSMGAVAAILRVGARSDLDKAVDSGSENDASNELPTPRAPIATGLPPKIAACVLDSPYSCFQQLAREMASGRLLRVPSFLQGFMLRTLRREIKARAGFDIDKLSPLTRAPQAWLPALIVVATDDDFVGPHHGEALFAAWGHTDRRLVKVGGNHNDQRPAWLLDEASTFLSQKLFEAAGCPAGAGSISAPLSGCSTPLLLEERRPDSPIPFVPDSPRARPIQVPMIPQYLYSAGKSRASSAEKAAFPCIETDAEDVRPSELLAQPGLQDEHAFTKHRPSPILIPTPGFSAGEGAQRSRYSRRLSSQDSSPDGACLEVAVDRDEARLFTEETMDSLSTTSMPPNTLIFSPFPRRGGKRRPPMSKSVLPRSSDCPLVERLRGFRGLPRLKQAALLVIAGWAPGGSGQQALRDIFMALDEDCDGLLSAAELRRGLSLAGLTDVLADLQHFMRLIAGDGAASDDSLFDYTEWLAALLEEEDYQDVNLCRAAFDLFDRDGDGRLTAQELSQVICGRQWSSEESESPAPSEKNTWDTLENTFQLPSPGRSPNGRDAEILERKEEYLGIGWEDESDEEVPPTLPPPAKPARSDLWLQDSIDDNPEFGMDPGTHPCLDPSIPPDLLLQLAEELEDIDLNGDGVIDFSEFMSMMLSRTTHETALMTPTPF